MSCCCYSVAEANDIVKMYSNQSSLVNITNHLDTNQSDTPYRLELVAAHYNGKRSNLNQFHQIQCNRNLPFSQECFWTK